MVKTCQTTCTCIAFALTARKIYNKLSAVNAPMDMLEPLERRLDELLAHLSAVRRDNAALRQRIHEIEAERDRLTRTIDTAAKQLEALHDKLPA